jgi:hypothetical protein
VTSGCTTAPLQPFFILPIEVLFSVQTFSIVIVARLFMLTMPKFALNPFCAKLSPSKDSEPATELSRLPKAATLLVNILSLIDKTE